MRTIVDGRDVATESGTRPEATEPDTRPDATGPKSRSDTTEPEPRPGGMSAPEPRMLRIAEAADEIGLTARAVRYYEELGLLKPAARSEGSYRLFDEDDIERLRFIRGLRDDAGFSLAEIGRMLEDEDARERNRERFRASRDLDERTQILRDALARVERQRTSLNAKARRIAEMLAEVEAREAHLRRHIKEIEAGDEPSHSERSNSGHARPRPER